MTITSIALLFGIILLTYGIARIQHMNNYDLESRHSKLLTFLKSFLIIAAMTWICYTSYDIYTLYKVKQIPTIKFINI